MFFFWKFENLFPWSRRRGLKFNSHEIEINFDQPLPSATITTHHSFRCKSLASILLAIIRIASPAHHHCASDFSQAIYGMHRTYRFVLGLYLEETHFQALSSIGLFSCSQLLHRLFYIIWLVDFMLASVSISMEWCRIWRKGWIVQRLDLILKWRSVGQPS